VCALPAECFGSGWFEGFDFLEAVFRQAAVRGLELSTASTYLLRQPDLPVVEPNVSTWTETGWFDEWVGDDTAWVFQGTHSVEHRLAELSRQAGDRKLSRALGQAFEELFHAQCAEWPNMIIRGVNVGYAVERVRDHLEAAAKLANDVERRSVDAELIAERRAAWAIFPEMDFREVVVGAGVRS